VTQSQLNLSYLRGEVGREPGGLPSAVHLSRRELLQAGGTLALAATALGRSVRQMWLGNMELAWDNHRLVLKLGGAERWSIDTRRFGGDPTLSVSRAGDLIRMNLAGATYPGTALPADLTGELRRVGSEWRLHLLLGLGGFAADVPFIAWLEGTATARSRVQLADTPTPLGAAGSLQLAGTGDATFAPDWQMRLTGPAVAHIATAELEAQADTVTLALAPAEAASLLQHPAARRTLITLHRQGREWGSWAALGALDGGRILAEGNPFDQIRIEAHETQKGATHQALMAESSAQATGQASAMAYLLGQDVSHPDGRPARLDLTNPRFAIAYDAEAGDQSGLVARFRDEPAWVLSQGFSLQLGGGARSLPLELVARGGTTVRRSVVPAVLSMAAAMPGAIVEPIAAVGAGETQVAAVDGVPVEVSAGPGLPGTLPVPPEVALPVKLPNLVLNAPAGYISVVRPVDLLSFEVRFINFKMTARAGAAPRLERAVPQRDSYLVFKFPPQHVAEQVYHDPGPNPAAPPVPSRAAGPSWLAFKLPPDTNSLEYTLEALLNWPALVPVTVTTRRNPSNNDGIAEPITAIEAPYRIFLAPSPNTGWTHQIAPVTLGNRTELWHTRLVLQGRERSGDAHPSVRAIWSPDYTNPPPSSESPPIGPFPYAMDGRQRYEIVALSPTPLRGRAQPAIRVENLMLTSLGAWMKIEGKWDPPDGFKVCAWRHEATFGRDQFVKVVEQGYLYPFGHLAVHVTETQRRIEPVPLTSRQAAYLRLREYIVVVEKERVYPGPEGVTDVDLIKRNRNNPLRKVIMLTGTTPDLEDADDTDFQVPELGADAFWPRVNGVPFPFHMVGEDWEGKRVEFATPVIFVSNIPVTADDAITRMGWVRNEFARLDDRRTVDMKGQRIAYAAKAPVPNPQPGETVSDTIFETASLLLTSTPTTEAEGAMPPFLPQLDKALVTVPQLTQMTGTKAPQAIKMDDAWLKDGFGGANPGMVFAKLDSPPSLAFGGDKSGAVITPDLDLAGLSLSHGLVGGDTNKFAGGKFDPKTFFGNKAKILGGIVLAEIIDEINDVTAGGDKEKVPRITSKLHYPGDDRNQPPDAINTDLIWTPRLISFGPFLNYFNPDKDHNEPDAAGTLKATLTVTGNIHVPLKGGGEKKYHVHGELNNFTVDLFDCVQLGFSRLVFTSDSGKSPKTDVGLKWVKFEGALEFVEKLREYLGNIFGGGFKLDVEPIGVRATLTVGLPSVSLGVFSLTNMSISAGLDLPFTGDKPAMVNFAFCSRENPFNLSVSMLGGGGFFGLTLGLSGVEILEVALEFGAAINIDLGVASGGVSVKAGIYFKYAKAEGATLEGYLKIHGEMSVMFIASLSITLYLSLTYKDPSKCWGQATLTVEVEVLFLSFSVEVHAERQFSGKEGDPPMSKMTTASQWSEYTGAFA